MTLTLARLARLTLGVLALGSSGAFAQQGDYPPPSANPVCQRLEAQLAAIDRVGSADPARVDQIRRYEDSVNRQQQELDRTVSHSRRLGCEGGGFFSLFGGGQNPQCPQINQQVQQMRGNLDRMLTELQRLQSGGGDREQQRQTVFAALGQNNCGPQYNQAVARPRGFFDSLFGGFGGNRNAPDAGGGPGAPLPPETQNTTYRTLCVRTCDGYYFPISFSATQSKFREDEQTCQRSCPAAETVLITHRNPGEDVSQAVTLSGKPYTELPNAFKYRTSFDAACSCRKPGQSWADALGAIKDTTVERGDIVVTEERSKALSVPLDSRGRPITAGQKKPDPKAAGTPPDQADATPDTPKRAIRSVGPPFVAPNTPAPAR